MKVLQVSPRYPPQVGGVERQVQGLSERLADRGHEVMVRTSDAGKGGTRRETRNEIRLRRHRAVAPGDALHLAPGLVGAVRRSDADVVHAHNVHSLPLTFAALASRRPVVATTYYHGQSASRAWNWLWTMYRPLARLALRRVALVTAVSAWERASLAADFGVESTVVPIGIDTARFASSTPVERDRPYLLCVARLAAYKGVQHVVRAIPELPEYDLLVAGDGPYRGNLERLAKEGGIDHRVEFLGTVDHDDLPGYYAGATAYVSLSRFESFGITVAEALASGTSCVVLDSTALSDWTDRADVVSVERVDPSTVANAIREASDRAAPSEPVPSWDEVVDRYERAYEQVVTAT